MNLERPLVANSGNPGIQACPRADQGDPLEQARLWGLWAHPRLGGPKEHTCARVLAFPPTLPPVQEEPA